MKTIEISKTCSYGGIYDVVVCGGGPAGVCAAISAAREGAKTLLIERNGGLEVSGQADCLPGLLMLTKNRVLLRR